MLRKGSAILTTIMLLFGIAIISILGLDIIMNGLLRRRAEGASAKAFYAAEAGAEKVFLAFKVKPTALMTSCVGSEQYFNFSSNDCSSSDPGLTNLEDQATTATYTAKVKLESQNVKVNARGNYQGVARQLYVEFCLPSCAGKICGSDGCGGVCLPGCDVGQSCAVDGLSCF